MAKRCRKTMVSFVKPSTPKTHVTPSSGSNTAEHLIANLKKRGTVTITCIILTVKLRYIVTLFRLM